MIGTTNHPENVDPALLHRPSRFDRVWMLGLPDTAMRRTYLTKVLPHVSEILIEKIVRSTRDWSFAYLNELRTTAAIMAIQRGGEEVTGENLEKALDFLGGQFRAGKQNHVVPVGDTVGFAAA